MELYTTLTPQQKQQLLQFPAYISLLAANADGKFDEREKQKAVDIAHIKNYDNKEPLLTRFYTDVQATFGQILEELDAQLPRDKDQREEAIKNGLARIENVLSELGPEYVKALHRSMQAFKEYVSRAHDNVLEHFLFPLPIKGITQ